MLFGSSSTLNIAVCIHSESGPPLKCVFVKMFVSADPIMCVLCPLKAAPVYKQLQLRGYKHLGPIYLNLFCSFGLSLWRSLLYPYFCSQFWVHSTVPLHVKDPSGSICEHEHFDKLQSSLIKIKGGEAESSSYLQAHLQFTHLIKSF